MTGIHDSVETYEPKVNMGYENSIPKVDTSFDDITDENGNINIIINSDVIGQTLAKKIYTSWSSGLRELYNNEARACRIAKSMGANPSIIITINPNDSSRELTIQGVDSLGITKAMFNKVLRVIGTSGNNDSNEIGQFGMGFISYALLTDALLLETWSRENDEHYAMLCDSGLKFKPIPLETNNEISTMSEYGTKLTMTCNNDVRFSEAIYHIKELARFSNIPTKIILLDNVEGVNSYYGRENGGNIDYDKGIIECVSFKNGMEYIKEDSNCQYLQSTSRDNSDHILLYEEITIDCEDYRFDGIMVINQSKYGSVHMNTGGSHTKMLLAGTGIDSSITMNGFLKSIINIKNERKYQPVASRDSLDTKAIETLQIIVRNDVAEYMSKYNIASIDEYNKSLHKCVLARDVIYELDEYLDVNTVTISSTLNSRYGTPDKSTSSLSDMLSTGGNIVCLKSLRMDLMKALDEHLDGNVLFFRIPKKLSYEQRGHRIELFKQLGIIMGEEYKKDNKIKEKRSTITKIVGGVSKSVAFNGDRSIILYNSKRGYNEINLYGNRSGWRSGSEKFSSTIQDVNDNVHDKMLTTNTKTFDRVVVELNRYTCNWKVMHDMKGLDDKIKSYDTLMIETANRMFHTNKGIVKGSDLVGKYELIVADEDLIDKVKSENDETIIAVPSNDDVISLLWYATDRELELIVDIYGLNIGDIIDISETTFNRGSCDDNKSTKVLRLYWIKQLLPLNYSNIFMKAIKYDSIDIDKIEEVARELNEVLKK